MAVEAPSPLQSTCCGGWGLKGDFAVDIGQSEGDIECGKGELIIRVAVISYHPFIRANSSGVDDRYVILLDEHIVGQAADLPVLHEFALSVELLGRGREYFDDY